MTPRRLVLSTPGRETIDLAGWYARRSVFLICSGPSLNAMDLSHLNQRGIVTFGLNNSWAVHRPNLWTCVDPPEKFCDRGWKDPGIIKLVPEHQRARRLRVKRDDGTFRPSQFRPEDMPSTFFYPASTAFDARRFWSQPSVCWGNNAEVPDAQGIKGGRSVMLAALRLIHYLGFRVVFLLGADFNMRTDADANYAFAQERTKQAVEHNNRLYRALDQRLNTLRRHVRDFYVFNCTPGSALTAFQPYDYAKAIAYASGECAGEWDTAGWYDRVDKDKSAPDRRSTACVHRRNVLRKTRCDSCGPGKSVAVYGCAIHGECVVHPPARVSQMNCSRCTNFERRPARESVEVCP
jgi:hypothetical protein